ncbi:MAG: hypothetical protein HOB82_08555 [Alphaproteobacteria bacterium]|jgi:hypothetical protein|nr:hypothetical protein [Alphaproteobacteria bacterium]MBT4711559.1 hypothetical protein [Alphaproteobacteria bacterium]MBT5860188.1 hypothetical protein [Alphaproteobacteria bacterium]
MQKILAISAALVLGFAVQAGAQEANSKEKAKLMVGACAEDFYSPMRASCIWWLRGAIEGHQAAALIAPAGRQFCFEAKWPNEEDLREIYVAWAEADDDRLEMLRTPALFAAVAEAFPCVD